MNQQRFWLFNTDETEKEGEGAYQKMIDQSCIAAWGSCKNQGAKKTLAKPQPGETVFLFCAGRGIIASGQATEEPPFVSKSIFGAGNAEGEYHRVVDNLRVLETPLTVAEVMKATGYQLPYRHIVCRLNDPAAVQYIIRHIDNASTIAIEDRDLSDEQIDQAIKKNRLRFKDNVDAFDKKVMARRRHGQARLHDLRAGRLRQSMRFM